MIGWIGGVLVSWTCPQRVREMIGWIGGVLV
jgi:hypothetical protein